jgi:SAM-dependent methyltransferase
VGCAYGSFLRQAASEFDCTGCDISEHAVRVATSRVPAASVFRSDIHDLDLTVGYDVITCFDVLEHVPGVEQALERLYRLLKPGGTLVATMPVYDGLVGKLVERLDHDPTHVHKIARYNWLERFRSVGFDAVAWKGIIRFYFGGPFYLHWCSSFLRRVSPAILVTGQVR